MKEMIRNRIERLLSVELGISPGKLNETGTVYSVCTDRKQPYIKILAYRNCVAVCTSEELSVKIPELLQGKSRDEIFELPFVYGQTIHYVPDTRALGGVSGTPGYDCEFFYGREILALKGLTGFENSLAFDSNGTTPAKAACIAREGGRMIGAAGASETSVKGVWEVGVDVMEEHRNAGLGTWLVSRLTEELLQQNIVPFYSASVTNIGSQMVAARCGYVPLWVDTYGTILDGSSVYHPIVRRLSL